MLFRSCPVCAYSGATPVYEPDDALQQMPRYECKYCGPFWVSDIAESVLKDDLARSKQLYKVAAILRERKIAGGGPIRLFSDTDSRSGGQRANAGTTIDDVLDRFPKTFADRVDRILLSLSRLSDYYGATVRLRSTGDEPVLFTRHQEEFGGMANYLKKLRYAEVTPQGTGLVDLVLTADGWARVEELQATKLGTESKQAFVAMWFSPDLDPIYHGGIASAISDAGFEPIRVDLIEHSDKICDRIIAEIRKSRFLVADFTGHRGGVYFEAGYAMGLGRPVIWLCRENDLVNTQFDTRQYNHIVWKTAADLRERLRERIEATIL